MGFLCQNSFSMRWNQCCQFLQQYVVVIGIRGIQVQGLQGPKSHPMLDDTWPRSWPSPQEEIRQRRRSLRLANFGFSLVAFLLLAVAVISILYVGPSPIAGPGAPPLHSRSTVIR